MLVLSENTLCDLNEDIDVKYINGKTISQFDGNDDVTVIACSRATAVAAEKLNFPNLKLVQLTSAGFDNVPLEAYKKKGVCVANAGTTYSTPIAEFIVYGMLSMAKRYSKNPNNHLFRPMRGYKYIEELSGKSVLIMGAGNIGTAVADRLLAFNMSICGYDPYSTDKPQYQKIFRARDELIKAIGEFDYVISTMPDTEETKKFIDFEIITAMKNTAVFVNVGRRAVINENDLYNALKGKKIGGAVLDMFEKIPNPITNPFRRLGNTIVLPGVVAISKEGRIRLRKHIENNIELISKSQQPNNVINGVKL